MIYGVVWCVSSIMHSEYMNSNSKLIFFYSFFNCFVICKELNTEGNIIIVIIIIKKYAYLYSLVALGELIC